MKSSLPAGAGTLIVHVRGVPVWPPQAAEPDEMSVSDWPMMVLPPCAYTLKSMPFVDGEMNFGRRTPLERAAPGGGAADDRRVMLHRFRRARRTSPA